MLKRVLLLMAVLSGLTLADRAVAQEREIRGTVTSSMSSRPLSTANVVLVGTNVGTLADRNGNFTLTVPAGEVRLRVSLIGYKSREVVVPAGQNTVTVELEEDVLNLEAVVVTGQATTVARRNLANAVSTVSAQELERVTSESLEKMVQGKIAGATIETNSGAPGGGVQVRMRGVSTITGESEPLWVVDGTIISNAAIPSNQNAVTEAAGGSNPSLQQDAVVNRVVDLNPNDIESIEVLKGASAAAIYGSRAANGVILITTKRGKLGAPQFRVTQRLGAFRPSNTLGFRQWTREEAVATYGADAAVYFNADGSPKQVFDHERDLASARDLSHETVVSVSGGADQTRYFVSGAWKNDEGIIPNTGFEKQALRINLDQQLGSRLSIGTNANIIHTSASRGLSNNDNSGTSFYMVLPFVPTFVEMRQQPDGTFPDISPWERSNPLQTAALMQNEEDVWRLITGANATLNAFERGAHSVKVIANTGVDFFSQVNDLLFPPELHFEDDDGLPGSSLLSNSQNLDITLGSSVVHTYRANAGWSATTSGGMQFQDRDLNISRIVSRNLIAGQGNIDAGTSTGVFEARQRVKDFGIYGQEELLLLDERLLLTGGVRMDRSSANGDTEKYFVYPKAAASYRFDNPLRHVDAVKLRTAWGQSGNQPLYGQKFTALRATNNIAGLPGLVVDAVAGDANIQPERQTEIEGGVDVTLLGGNAQLEMTGFVKTTENLLLRRTLAPTSGFTTQIFNGGEMEVRGMELALSATPVSNDRLRWISRTTFYADRSEITELPVPAFLTGGFGTSLGAFKIEKGASATQIVANAGRDADGNVIVKKVGDASPDFRMGFSNELAFGSFNLYTLLDWSQGQSVINLTQFLADAGQNSVDFATNKQAFTRRNGTVIQAGEGQRRLLMRGDFQDSRGYIEDGSYVKLREVSLSYSLPTSVRGRLFGENVDDAQLTFSGRNLLTFTDYMGLDPEVSNFGNQPIARNIDVAPFPPSRSFWVSFNVSF